MTDKPSEAAIREACRRAEYKNEAYANAMVKNEVMDGAIALAASLIEKYEPDTLINPVTRRAREIYIQENPYISPDNISRGLYDNSPAMRSIIRALKEGMPK